MKDDVEKCDMIEALSYLFRQRKGGVGVELLTSLMVAVMAGVITHVICKWLDGDDKK